MPLILPLNWPPGYLIIDITLPWILWCLAVCVMVFKAQVQGWPWKSLLRKTENRHFLTHMSHESFPKTWPWYCGHLSLLLNKTCGHLLPSVWAFPLPVHFSRVEAHSSYFLSNSSLHHGLGSVRANMRGSAACSTVWMCDSIGPSSLYSLATTTLSGFSSQLALSPSLNITLENFSSVCWVTQVIGFWASFSRAQTGVVTFVTPNLSQISLLGWISVGVFLPLTPWE